MASRTATLTTASASSTSPICRRNCGFARSRPQRASCASIGKTIRSDACIELDWLAAHARGGGQRRPELAQRPWLGGAGLVATRDFAWGRLAEAREDSRVRLTWLTRLLQDGLAFLSGVPAQETALLRRKLAAAEMGA